MQNETRTHNRRAPQTKKPDPRDDDYSDSQPGSDDQMEPDRPSARSPACPTCRDKKAKCERAHCANCGLPCIYTGCVMREKEAGSRSEQRLKEVNERLSKIEDTMGRILGLLEGGAAPTPSTTAPPSVAGQGGAEFDWPGWQGYRNGL